MRKFIVLGFLTNSKKSAGEKLYLGPDYSKAKQTCETLTGKYARRELYELATPILRRHREVKKAAPAAAEAKAEA